MKLKNFDLSMFPKDSFPKKVKDKKARVEHILDSFYGSVEGIVSDQGGRCLGARHALNVALLTLDDEPLTLFWRKNRKTIIQDWRIRHGPVTPLSDKQLVGMPSIKESDYARIMNLVKTELKDVISMTETISDIPEVVEPAEDVETTEKAQKLEDLPQA